MFIVSASGGQTQQFLANFDLGGSGTDPLLPMRVKFGVLEQTQGLHLHAKFHLNVFIVLASGGQKPQFWANFDIWGLLYRPLSPMRAKFGVLYTHRDPSTPPPQAVLDRTYREDTRFTASFQTNQFVLHVPVMHALLEADHLADSNATSLSK